jgi:hypothetical protein
MTFPISERKPSKFNEVFSSANRFIVTKKVENPFVDTGKERAKFAETVETTNAPNPNQGAHAPTRRAAR